MPVDAFIGEGQLLRQAAPGTDDDLGQAPPKDDLNHFVESRTKLYSSWISERFAKLQNKQQTTQPEAPPSTAQQKTATPALVPLDLLERLQTVHLASEVGLQAVWVPTFAARESTEAHAKFMRGWNNGSVPSVLREKLQGRGRDSLCVGGLTSRERIRQVHAVLSRKDIQAWYHPLRLCYDMRLVQERAAAGKTSNVFESLDSRGPVTMCGVKFSTGAHDGGIQRSTIGGLVKMNGVFMAVTSAHGASSRSTDTAESPSASAPSTNGSVSLLADDYDAELVDPVIILTSSEVTLASGIFPDEGSWQVDNVVASDEVKDEIFITHFTRMITEKPVRILVEPNRLSSGTLRPATNFLAFDLGPLQETCVVTLEGEPLRDGDSGSWVIDALGGLIGMVRATVGRDVCLLENVRYDGRNMQPFALNQKMLEASARHEPPDRLAAAILHLRETSPEMYDTEALADLLVTQGSRLYAVLAGNSSLALAPTDPAAGVLKALQEAYKRLYPLDVLRAFSGVLSAFNSTVGVFTADMLRKSANRLRRHDNYLIWDMAWQALGQVTDPSTVDEALQGLALAANDAYEEYVSRAKISLVPVPEDRPDYRMEGLAASLYFAALLGIAGTAPINYVLGRRAGLALFAIFVFAGHFMYMFANSLGLLLGARVLTGIGRVVGTTMHFGLRNNAGEQVSDRTAFILLSFVVPVPAMQALRDVAFLLDPGSTTKSKKYHSSRNTGISQHANDPGALEGAGAPGISADRDQNTLIGFVRGVKMFLWTANCRRALYASALLAFIQPLCGAQAVTSYPGFDFSGTQNHLILQNTLAALLFS
ncbi:unnamed protein product [Parascedosporium putredinis]|uniref:Uncharacterized protein n=1 Tax=Parascedosporium putredinis TaxID=1442378 RepID=A0A9P1H0P6_9PEZI|nr:unnamed protein product [Parascedosporium putredinis]CAI7994142.1 unnamed protein product [Parascedosporium putredinis]